MAGILFIGGISCCAAALVFSKLSTVNERNAEILKSVTRVQQLKDLAQLLDAEKSPLVVAISGRVVSETPIECQMSRLSGVIIEERVEELNLQKDVAFEQEMKCNDDVPWELRYEKISSISKEVPWYLDDGTDRVHVVGARGASDFVLPAENSTFEESDQKLVRKTLDLDNWKREKDDGTDRVHVVGALDATDLVLIAENSTFEESDPKLVCKTLDNRKSKMTIGFRRTERVLPVGTSLNVVGEASKDDDGTVRIQRPPEGPFYVSSKTIDEHTTNLVDSSRWCKNCSEFLTVFAASIIATSAICYFLGDDTAVNYEIDSQVAA